jgi:hypothetical protein
VKEGMKIKREIKEQRETERKEERSVGRGR